MDKITVVVSTFNRCSILPRAIKSVLGQYFQDWELIIVDDCSTDKTEQVVKKFKDDRIRYIKLGKNSGSDTHPKNVGIKEAKGEYVCFLDDDDEYFSDHLQVLYNQMKGEGYDIIYGDRIVYNEHYKQSFVGISNDFNMPMLGQMNYIAMCDPLIKRSALIEVGGFDETLPKFVDWNLWVRLGKAGFKWRHIAIPISKVWLHTNTKSTRVKHEQDANGNYLPTFFDPVTCPIYSPKTCLGTQKKYKVAIFTLTKDRLEYTKKMYKTMKDFAGYPFDWFVVDQGSTDGTPEWLKSHTNARITGLKENVGISKGSNMALDAIGNDYDIIIKVDNDCFFLTKDWLKNMVDLFKINHQVALSPYVEGLKDHPGGTPRGRESGTNPYVKIGDNLLGMVSHLGGICIAVPAKAYELFRWPEIDFYSGEQDWRFSQWCKAIGYNMMYIENIRVSHGGGTAEQQKNLPEYFKLRVWENTNKYGGNNNGDIQPATTGTGSDKVS